MAALGILIGSRFEMISGDLCILAQGKGLRAQSSSMMYKTL